VGYLKYFVIPLASLWYSPAARGLNDDKHVSSFLLTVLNMNANLGGTAFISS